MDANQPVLDANDPRILNVADPITPQPLAQPSVAQGLTPVFTTRREEVPLPQAPQAQTPPVQEPQTDFDAPVPVTITMPGGAPIPQPQVQPIQPVVLPKKGNETVQDNKVAPRSYFMDDRSSYAGRVEMEDGTWFEFDPMDDADIEEYNGTTERWCSAIGWSQETHRIATLLERGLTARELGLSVEQLKALVLTPEQEREKTRIELEARRKVVTKYVTAWSFPARCNEDRKAKLHPDIIRLLSDKIAAFSIYGISEATFRQAGRASSATG
jgi:hypothetical protein